MSNFLVTIIAGTEFDREVLQKAVDVLQHFDIGSEMINVSGFRLSASVLQRLTKMEAEGHKVIIAGSSAGQLPGLIAAKTLCPVIAVPTSGGGAHPVDTLWSMVQTPVGVPVAALGVDNAENAALLAVQILAVSDNELIQKLLAYRRKMTPL